MTNRRASPGFFACRGLPTARRLGGFTLIEVMVGFVLVATLLLAMNTLWFIVAREIDYLTLRQKAVFRLNGEMERLTEWYRGGSADTVPTGTTTGNTSGYDTAPTWASGDYVSNPSTRNIYDRTTDGTRGMVTIEADANGLSLDEVFYFDSDSDATVGGNDRNFVLLDSDQNIAARLSWSLTEAHTTCGALPGYGAPDPCFFLTLYLDFPFRFDTTDGTVDVIEGSPVETITLQTIVGGRS